MPYTIGLVRYDDSFTNATAITIQGVQEFCKDRSDLKIENEGDSDTLLIWHEAQQEWLPLLWISEDSNSINANPIFDFGLYYDLVALAKYLDACIISEEGYLLYSSKLGFLVDPDERIDYSVPVISIAKALQHTSLNEIDLSLLYKQHYQNSSDSIPKQQKQIKISKKTENWIVLAIFVVAILVFFLIKKFR